MTELVVVALAVLAFVSLVVTTLRTGISPWPSGPRAVASIIELLPEQLGGPVFELGSGFGTLAIAIARARPDVQVVGYELSPVPWLVSRALRLAYGVRNLELRRADFARAELSGAGAVVCYLHPGGMERLAALLHDLPEEAVVISHAFALPDAEPEQQRSVGDLWQSRVYRYRPGGARRRSAG